MAIFAGIIGMLGRFAGQLLNTTLGWATLLLFGKVPQKKQVVLLVMVFGSLIWVALVVGVIFPNVGTLLIGFVPAKDIIGEQWVRLGMLIGAFVVPLLLGVAAVFVTEPGSRPKGLGIVVAILRGYPFAAVLALVLVLLAVVASVRKIRSMMRRWEDAHVPIIVKPGKYEELFSLIENRLDSAGLDLTPRDAGRLISGPPKLLDLIAGRALGDLVPDHLKLLVGKNVEILVYPSDIAISGTRELVARSRAAIVHELTEAPAYMTTSAEAQKFEDELERMGPGAAKARPEEMVRHVRSLDKRLATLAVPFEEWETLYRMRVQLERDALVAGGVKPGGEVSSVAAAPARPASRLDLAIGLAGAALIAVDMVLLLGDRRRRGTRGRDAAQR